MDTPRETTLYRKIAKDYNAQRAAMMICKYIEGLEARIEGLEGANKRLTAEIAEFKSGGKSKKKDSGDFPETPVSTVE